MSGTDSIDPGIFKEFVKATDDGVYACSVLIALLVYDIGRISIFIYEYPK